jgi:hypothetical protein
MLRQARREDTMQGRRSAPSPARTRQMLRQLRGRTARIPLEARVIAIRNEKQLV